MTLAPSRCAWLTRLHYPAARLLSWPADWLCRAEQPICNNTASSSFSCRFFLMCKYLRQLTQRVVG